MSSAIGLLVPLLLGVLTSIEALSPNGSHVCSKECHTLGWETVQVTRACGYPLFVNTCKVSVRQPSIKKATCYECCEGWRQSDDDNCLTECVTGSAGITSCTDLPDGWYQLCDACDEFAQCAGGELARRRCPKKRHWDDLSKKCVKHSQTCESDRHDTARFKTNDIEPVETERDEMNELTNEVGAEISGTTHACEDIDCDAPGRCMMLFAQDTYRLMPKCICPAGMRMSETESGKCTSIDECMENNPCLNGRCVDRMFGYTCRCERGWRGRHCNKPRRRNRKHRSRERVRVEVHHDRNREDDDDMSWDL